MIIIRKFIFDNMLEVPYLSYIHDTLNNRFITKGIGFSSDTTDLDSANLWNYEINKSITSKHIN